MKNNKSIAAILFLILITASNVSAQTEQGAWVIGASSDLSFLSTDSSPDKTTQIGLDVQAGYFVIDNLALGLAVGVDNAKQGDAKSTSIAVGALARYYINGTFFLGGSFSSIKTNLEGTGFSADASGTALGFEAGYAIFLNDNVAIEPSLNYDILGGDFDSKIFGLNIGFSIYL